MRRSLAVCAFPLTIAMSLWRGSAPAAVVAQAPPKATPAPPPTATPTPAGGPAAPEVILVDARSPAGAVTTGRLTNGAGYQVTVRGTYSRWPLAAWAAGAAGTPEPQPVFPGSGVPNGGVGVDAEWLFARPTGVSDVLNTGPTVELSLDGGASWAAPSPRGLPGKNAHEFTYTVVGRGAAFGLRVPDSDATGNYGVLGVEVRPSSGGGGGTATPTPAPTPVPTPTATPLPTPTPSAMPAPTQKPFPGGTPAPPILTDEVLMVSSAAPQGSVTSTVTQAGATYRVTISGTASGYSPTVWNNGIDGQPEPAPMFTSGNVTGPVGTDPASIFARPAGTGALGPIAAMEFNRTGGGASGWISPGIGTPTGNRHEYTWTITGNGARLGVRMIDSNYNDNYGDFRVRVTLIAPPP